MSDNYEIVNTSIVKVNRRKLKRYYRKFLQGKVPNLEAYSQVSFNKILVHLSSKQRTDAGYISLSQIDDIIFACSKSYTYKECF